MHDPEGVQKPKARGGRACCSHQKGGGAVDAAADTAIVQHAQNEARPGLIATASQDGEKDRCGLFCLATRLAQVPL